MTFHKSRKVYDIRGSADGGLLLDFSVLLLIKEGLGGIYGTDNDATIKVIIGVPKRYVLRQAGQHRRWLSRDVTAFRAPCIPGASVFLLSGRAPGSPAVLLAKGTETVDCALGRNPRLPVRSHWLGFLTVRREEARNTSWLSGSRGLCC